MKNSNASIKCRKSSEILVNIAIFQYLALTIVSGKQDFAIVRHGTFPWNFITNFCPPP